MPQTERNYLSDLLIFAVAMAWSTQTETLKSLAGADAKMGTVLGKNTTTGKWEPLNLAANDGTEVAGAVLLEDRLVVSADVHAPLLRRGGVVSAPALIWPANITAAQKASAIAQLDGRGIVVKAVL